MRIIVLAVAASTLSAAAPSDAATDNGDGASLTPFAGVWEVVPRGERRGGPRAGPGREERKGQGAGQGERFGPGAGRPPQGAPEDDGSDLPGPNVEGLDRGDKMTYAIMTPAGKAAFEAMDPHDLPSNNCKSNGLPSLVAIPDVQQWTFHGDTLTIRYADFDTERTIHLDGSAPNGPPSLYGYSSGVFANGELVVTTTNLIATPGGLGRNAPGSASRSYVEHYRLSAEGSQVTGYLTIHDPEYLTRDLTRPIAFLRNTQVTEIPDVECSVEASQRYLGG